MKKLKYISGILVLTLFMFTSCEQAELYPKYGEQEGQTYVAFANSSQSISESASVSLADGSVIGGDNIATITLERIGTDLSDELSVSVTATAVYVEDNDFVSAGEDASGSISFKTDLSNIVFEAGESEATINLVSINNDISDGSITVSLAITSVSDSRYQIGYQGNEVRSTLSVTINDDDCPIDLASFEGTYTYSVIGTSYNASFADADLCGFGICPTGDITLTADPSDPNGLSAILTGADIGGEYVIEFVTCPKEVIAVNRMDSFLGRTAWRMQQGQVPGSYDEDSKSIVINGVLGTNGDWGIVMEKN